MIVANKKEAIMIDRSKDYAVALEGGGIRGAYQAGALVALDEAEISIVAVTGTSVGSLNGALVAANQTVLLAELWHTIKPSDIFMLEEGNVDDFLDVEMLSLADFGKGVVEAIKRRGLDITPFKQLLNRYVDETEVRSSKIDFGLVTVSLSDRKPLELMCEDIPVGQLHDFLVASSYLPAFKQEPINGKYYIDGGFYNIIPTSMLVERGYQNIIEIRLGSMGRRIDISPEINCITLSPKEDLGRALFFDRERMDRNYWMGYYDMQRLLNGYPGSTYYFTEQYHADFYQQQFLKINKQAVEPLVGFNLGDELPRERFIYERLIPALVKHLNLEKTADYRTIYLALIERCGRFLGVSRWKLYSLASFRTALFKKYIKKKEDTKKEPLIMLGLSLLHDL